MELTKKHFRFGENHRKLPILVDDNGMFSVMVPKDVAKKLDMPESDRRIRCDTMHGVIERVEAVGNAYGQAASTVSKVIVIDVYDRMFTAGVFEMSVASNGVSDIYRWTELESRLKGGFSQGWGGYKFQEEGNYLPWSEQLESIVFEIQEAFDLVTNKLLHVEGSMKTEGLTMDWVLDLHAWVKIQKLASPVDRMLEFEPSDEMINRAANHRAAPLSGSVGEDFMDSVVRSEAKRWLDIWKRVLSEVT